MSFVNDSQPDTAQQNNADEPERGLPDSDADLLEALSQEIEAIGEDARKLLYRRRQLRTWRKEILDKQVRR